MIQPVPRAKPPSRCRPPILGRRLLGLAFIGLLFAGCDPDFGVGSRPGGVLYELSLVAVSGDGQVVPSGGIESEPLVVRLLDQRDSPFSGLRVDWKVVRGAGTLSAASSVTASDGHAQATYISGNETEDMEIVATLSLSSGGGSLAGREVPPVSFGLKMNE